MSEPLSALPGAVFEGTVRVEEAGLQGMVSLRGNLDDPKLTRAVGDLAGVELPGQREVRIAGDRGLLWMAPDELLILAPHAEAPGVVATLEATLAGTHSLAANVSDARAMYRLTGANVREVLARLTPADLRPAAFGPGQIRRSRIAQIPAAFWMVEEGTVHLVCFRSVAEYAFDLLANAAAGADSLEMF